MWLGRFQKIIQSDNNNWDKIQHKIAYELLSPGFSHHCLTNWKAKGSACGLSWHSISAGLLVKASNKTFELDNIKQTLYYSVKLAGKSQEIWTMKRNYPVILAFGIIILFFIQLAGTLVESIYILDLMNTNLDEKVLGLLFFFTPILLIPFYKKFPRRLSWITFGVLFLTRGTLPYLNTAKVIQLSPRGYFL